MQKHFLKCCMRASLEDSSDRACRVHRTLSLEFQASGEPLKASEQVVTGSVALPEGH